MPRKAKGEKSDKVLKPAQKKMVKKIAKSLLSKNVEIKYAETASPAVDQQFGIGGGAYSQDVMLIPQATSPVTDSARVGDRLFLKSMQWRFTINSQTTNGFDAFRCIVVQYHPSSTTYNVANILLNGPSGGLDPWSMYNHDYRESYTILYDKTFSSQCNLAADDNTINKHVHVPLKYAKKQIQYVGGSVAGQDHIFLLVLGRRTVGANGAVITSQVRVYFSDS